MIQLPVKTNQRIEMIDITSLVQRIVNQQKVKDGICSVFVPHTTAGVTINENADPDVVRDIIMELGKIVPCSTDYRHREGNSDAHIKASLFGASENIFIENGKLVLGTWQSLYFCEFDGPRTRKILVKILNDSAPTE